MLAVRAELGKTRFYGYNGVDLVTRFICSIGCEEIMVLGNFNGYRGDSWTIGHPRLLGSGNSWQ